MMDSTTLFAILLMVVMYGAVYILDTKKTAREFAVDRKNFHEKERYLKRLEKALQELDPERLKAVKDKCDKEWEEAHRREDGVIDFTSSNIPRLPPL